MAATSPLKKIRERRNLSSYELAEAVGVRQPTINRIENGKLRPSPRLAILLAEYFGEGITRDEIMFPEFHDLQRKPVRRATLAPRLVS
jgi:DNA-binding XRE family transcriptional regulator